MSTFREGITTADAPRVAVDPPTRERKLHAARYARTSGTGSAIPFTYTGPRGS
jgi:hypothetical protein